MVHNLGALSRVALLTSGILCSANLASAADPGPGPYAKLKTAKIYHFQEFVNGELRESCSATMVKDAGVCHLVTDYHCVRDFDATFQINRDPSVPDPKKPYLDDVLSGPKVDPINVRVIKQDPDIDLAEISPNIDRNVMSDCQELSNTFDYLKPTGGPTNDPADLRWDVDPYENAESIGYTKTGPKLYRAGEWYGELRSTLNYDPELSERHLIFLQLSALKVEKGMSGGIVIDQNELWPAEIKINVLGFITRLIDQENTTYIIPARFARDFIRAPLGAALKAETPLQKEIYDRLDGCGEAGDNEHTPGGDNEHAGVGSCETSTGSESSSDPIQLPEEGYLSGDGHTRILALAGFPVNGFDDLTRIRQYLKDFESTNGPHNKFDDETNFPNKQREDTGYLEYSDRISILDRLQGYYGASEGDGPLGYRIFEVDDKNRLYPKFFTFPSLFVSIKKSLNQEYRFEFRENDSMPWTCPTNGPCEIPLKLDIKGVFQFNGDATEIDLTLSDQEKLKCDNRGYRQIICRGPSTTFYFGHRIGLGFPNADSFEVKLIRKTSVEDSGKTVPLIHYFYGMNNFYYGQ